MIVKWFGQGIIEPQQLRDLEISHIGMIVGLVKTGETFEDEDEERNPITREVRKHGVAINFPDAPSDEVLEKIDLLLPFCKREGGKDFVTKVSENLDLRTINPQKEAFQLSQFYGLTQHQVADYIQNQMDSISSLAEAKTVIGELLKKIGAIELFLVKQTKLDE